MGAAGTDVAIETADVTLMNDDLSQVVNFMDMSRKVLLRIKLNIFFSIIYNVIGFILAGFGMLTPVLAVIFQEAGCITVVFSSTLLLWSKTGSPLKNDNNGSLPVVPLTVENAMIENVSQCA
jgi:cation transport ATPase